MESMDDYEALTDRVFPAGIPEVSAPLKTLASIIKDTKAEKASRHSRLVLIASAHPHCSQLKKG